LTATIDDPCSVRACDRRTEENQILFKELR
jgi:hypothetical protein